jgi:hypothetical protein
VKRGRLVFLLAVLLSLTVCYLIRMVVSVYQWPSVKKPTLWLTQEKFYQYIEGERIALPNGESLTIHKEQIESLSIEPGERAPESEGADASFVVKTDQGRYGLQALMSLHRSDIYVYPIVNLGLGWNITKK